jgi:hypothetical protein
LFPALPALGQAWDAAVDVELTREDLREIEAAQVEAEDARDSESSQRMIDR